VIVKPAGLVGAFLVEPERLEDDRGFFARTWCRAEFGAADLPTTLAQASISFNRRRGTLRGMHFQRPPDAETKLVRCTTGKIWDVALDLRPTSPTYRQHVGFELSSDNRLALLVPAGCAHGFQALTDGAEVLYQMDVPHAPKSAAGVRWDDPAFGIPWPVADPILSPRDANWPDWVEQA
jgi:dTDP-4-dehydrorhamnose 3,5-epimerase